MQVKTLADGNRVMQGLGVIQRKSWLHESHDVLDHITFYNAFAEFEFLGSPPSIPAHCV